MLDASHELRTPLTSLRTNMEVARRMDELAPEEREVLIGDVLTQLDELTSVVADLAELARGEQPVEHPEPVRLDLVVEEAVGVATTHGRSRGVTFTPFITPSWVMGSRPRIERAVGNLLDNALKWSPEGGSVEVSCSAGTVLVRDHGPGVADEDLDHLFDRFYRAPERPGAARLRPRPGHRGPGRPGGGRIGGGRPRPRWRGPVPVHPPGDPAPGRAPRRRRRVAGSPPRMALPTPGG